MHIARFGKRAGVGLFLFFLAKGLVWVAIFGATAAGIHSL